MTEREHDAGLIDPERQFEMCHQGFRRTFGLLLDHGFHMTHVLCGMLAATTAAIKVHGDNYTDEGMAQWMEDFAEFLKSRKKPLN